MSKESKNNVKDFDKLYQYVKKEIMGYNSDMALPKFMVMRLKGLSEGKFYANNKIKSKAHYDYQTIYLTFMFCKDKIYKALQTKKFTSEQNKFNYIMAIIENNINDVVIRIQKLKQSKDKSQKYIQNINIDLPNNSCVDNKKDSVNKKNISSSHNQLNNKFNNLTKEMW